MIIKQTLILLSLKFLTTYLNIVKVCKLKKYIYYPAYYLTSGSFHLNIYNKYSREIISSLLNSKFEYRNSNVLNPAILQAGLGQGFRY